MEFSAEQLAEHLGGTVDGNPQAMVNTFAKIEEGKPGALSFLANPKYSQYIYDTDSSIVIVNNDFVPEKEINTTLLRVKDAYSSFAVLLNMYNEFKNNKVGISSKSDISDSANLGENIYVGAFAVIGDHVIIGNNVKIYPNVYIGDNTIIGDNTTIHAGANIYHECIIGTDCTIHSGVVIGADGFGFAPNSENQYNKIAQIGNVIIENHVEIGAGTTIDRATMGSTIIRKGVKLDNLIQIAHNCEVGENTVIAAQTGIAGSTKIGANCMIGGQVAIIGHATIADNVKIAAKSGIPSSIKKEGEIVMGPIAFNIKDFQKSYILFRRLPQLAERLKKLESFLKSEKNA
ncbi:MAG: UDP-3-O-[3-hydroxymyristoyl] glucosamine N-acyltransferase [Flavobacteriales bacterium]|jgi:UDP-3-O-[3-hydroxymyristoyl] glucosamine N-acyltransferase